MAPPGSVAGPTTIAGHTKVKAFAIVALRPLAFVSTTFTLPGVCGGVVPVSISPLTATLGQRVAPPSAAPPNVTLVPLAALGATSVTAVPPLVDPLPGATLATSGVN